MKARYAQTDIYSALGISAKKERTPQAEQRAELVGGSAVLQSASTPGDASITYFVNRLPVCCFDCPCSRTWQTKTGKTVKCQITGKFDPADKQGGKERRKDCPLKVIK